ncbi:MAG: hypothetical protein AMXMBFR57_07120 [Acidimicrobiia bacterium]
MLNDVHHLYSLLAVAAVKERNVDKSGLYLSTVGLLIEELPRLRWALGVYCRFQAARLGLAWSQESAVDAFCDLAGVAASAPFWGLAARTVRQRLFDRAYEEIVRSIEQRFKIHPDSLERVRRSVGKPGRLQEIVFRPASSYTQGLSERLYGWPCSDDVREMSELIGQLQY